MCRIGLVQAVCIEVGLEGRASARLSGHACPGVTGPSSVPAQSPPMCLDGKSSGVCRAFSSAAIALDVSMGLPRLAVRTVKGAFFAFIGAKRKPLIIKRRRPRRRPFQKKGSRGPLGPCDNLARPL